jgi:hypothetical protein
VRLLIHGKLLGTTLVEIVGQTCVFGVFKERISACLLLLLIERLIAGH